MNLGNRFSQHSFAMVPDVRIARSQFDRSYTVKDTFDFDDLIPFHIDEVIPGDTHTLTINAFARLATQLVPIMDNMYIDFHFFFVPNRLVWENWEKLCGAQDNPGDSIDYTVPIMTPGAAFSVGSIFDHMGLPTDVANVPVDNTLPLRAYIKIYNDWFRDENLQNSVTLPTDDGPDIQGDFAIKKRGKRHDYFTSCLPWPQKGDAVELPLGTSALVKTSASELVTGAQAALFFKNSADGTHVTTARNVGIDNSTNLNRLYYGTDGGPAGTAAPIYPSNLYADLTNATAATVDQFIEAMLVQDLLRLDARAGTRYVEILRAHYGVISPDFRLQRAEFLGSGTIRINSHPVAQTSPTSGSDPQAQLAAFATAVASDRDQIGFSKTFVEHGYVIGIVSARADITYQQGLNRMWSKSTRYDFFWSKLQQLGEQSVLNKEIYCDPAGTPNGVFGYQERYAEYRYKPSEIRGQFRSTYATSLDFWHMAEEFGSQPALNSTYIVSSTPVDRAIAVPSEPHLLFDCWIKLRSARPMMTYGVPATLGRF